MEISKDSTIRTKRAKQNILAMFAIKGVGLLISFLYIPLLLHTLNTVDYGVWLTLTSIVSWISFFDIGLGNGLRNKLCEAISINDIQKARELVSTAYVSLVTFVVFLILLFLCFYSIIPWKQILNATSSDINNLDLLALIVVISFLLNFALSLINSILYALQLPAISSGLLTCGQFLSFVTVYILINNGVSSLFELGIVIAIIPPLVSFAASTYLFLTKFKNISPSIHLFKKNHIKSIFSLGIKFFILQIITLILYYSNNLIVTHVVGNEAVVNYNIVYKYAHILTMLFTIIATPIWSATTEAYSLGDFEWIKKINNKLIRIAFLFTISGIIMVLVFPFIFDFWLHEIPVGIDYLLVGLLISQSVFNIFYGCYGYILNGMGILKVQLIVTTILALLYIPNAIYFGHLWGLKGILFAFLINAVINFSWSKIQYSKIINHKAEGIWSK